MRTLQLCFSAALGAVLACAEARAGVGQARAPVWCRQLAPVTATARGQDAVMKKLGTMGGRAGGDYVKLESVREGENKEWEATGTAYDCGGEPPLHGSK
jgi:hypothetical protein